MKNKSIFLFVFLVSNLVLASDQDHLLKNVSDLEVNTGYNPLSYYGDKTIKGNFLFQYFESNLIYEKIKTISEKYGLSDELTIAYDSYLKDAGNALIEKNYNKIYDLNKQMEELISSKFSDIDIFSYDPVIALKQRSPELFLNEDGSEKTDEQLRSSSNVDVFDSSKVIENIDNSALSFDTIKQDSNNLIIKNRIFDNDSSMLPVVENSNVSAIDNEIPVASINNLKAIDCSLKATLNEVHELSKCEKFLNVLKDINWLKTIPVVSGVSSGLITVHYINKTLKSKEKSKLKRYLKALGCGFASGMISYSCSSLLIK